MSGTYGNRESRPVRLYTQFGTVEGGLSCSPVVRTLDELNVVTRGFVIVEGPSDGESSPGDTPLAVNKSAIVFVTELPRQLDPESAPRRPPSRGYAKAAIELQLGDHTIRGSIHVPPGGDAMARLNHKGHAFIAITGASWDGPAGSGSSGFVAVNRDRILAARVVAPAERDAPAEVEARA